MTAHTISEARFIGQAFNSRKLRTPGGVAFRKISAVTRSTTMPKFLFEAETRGFTTYILGDYIIITKVIIAAREISCKDL
jgi:hypothetical protein